MKPYCEEYDAYFNPRTDTWEEVTCDEPGCEFCSERPEKPSQVESLRKYFVEVQLHELKRQVKVLTDRVDRLEQAKQIPATPLSPYINPNMREWYGNCPKCGINLGQVMGYVCSNLDCPTGLGPTICSTN